MLVTGGLFILARVATPHLRMRQAREELAQLQRALDAFHAYHHRWPQTKSPTQFLHALMGRIDAEGKKTDVRWFVPGGRFNFRSANPDAPDAAIVDPWGRPYRYVYRTAQQGGVTEGYTLFSAGPDGRCSDPSAWGRSANGAAPEDADNLWASSEMIER